MLSLMFARQKRKAPNTADVVNRAIILKNIFVKGMANPPADWLVEQTKIWKPEESESFFAESRRWSELQKKKLQDSGLWKQMDGSERAFIKASPLEITIRMRIDSAWLAESIVCLLWAVGFITDLPPYDQQSNPELTNMLPNERATERALLRPMQAIEKQRGIAETWHWRSRTRQLQESGRMPKVLTGGITVEEILRLSASRAAQEGYFSVPIDGDFAALGKAYRDLTSEEFASLTSIAQERHEAFNWLCGYAPDNRWADTPTDT